jgi:uncharacterized damage-inducible protein DinB
VENTAEEKIMEIREMFLPEFDQEMKKTRAILERVPEGKPDFKPHQKSMALGKLAAHTAQLPEFAIRIVELPELDFSKSDMKPLVMESRQQLLDVFDSIVAKARAAIAKSSDEEWQKKWKLSFQGHTIVDAPRFLVYRDMFLNHIVHHRAQLGVYLRLNDIPLPATYGPSADDSMGF